MSAQVDDAVPNPPERSLDPDDWEALRSLGHCAVNDMIEYLRTVRERPVWRPVPESARRLFDEPLPEQAKDREEVYAEVKEQVLPYPTGNIHPRFWSWVGGTGTPTQLVADIVISAMNSGNLGFDEVSSTYVELQLLEWLKQLLEFPAESSGLLVSGGSMANLVGLAVARTHVAPYDIRETGVDTSAHPRLMYYASTETHSSVRKAIELMGLGEESLRLIPIGRDFTIDVNGLRHAIADDRRKGMLPTCIVANAGTVNTGATDPLNTLADIAEAESMWLHVDGAFGAFAKMSSSSSHIVDGLERADSLAFDLHKWLYVQYDCGCVLIRDRAVHKDTFSVIPSYIRNFDRGLASGPVNFSEFGVQLSRSFKALRAWMALKTEGAVRYREQIEQNIQQARFLAKLVEQQDELELLAPTSLNIVNFRFRSASIADDELDDFNAELLMRLQERGIAAPSSTELFGQFSIRVAICNHRSRRSDFAALVDGVIAIGNEMLDQARSGNP